MASLEEIAHDAAVRALEEQRVSLDELRGRTGPLLTAASVAASFLGAQAIAEHGLTVWVVLALAAFGASVLACLAVLLPREGLVFALDAPVLYEELYGIDEDESYRRLAYWLQGYRSYNEDTIAKMVSLFRGAVIALVLQILFLALSFALH
jgi:hypothetical protein